MDRVERLADLAVTVGANVQPDQLLAVKCDVGHLEIARAVAVAGYRRGARFVDVEIRDPQLVRSRVLCSSPDALGYTPRWPDNRIRELDDEHGAHITITGPTAPGLLDDLDPVAVVTATRPRIPAWREIDYRVNSTIVPGPNMGWATFLYPGLASVEALDALWADIVIACRLDLPDPAVAWRERFAELRSRADALSAMRLDRLGFHGPGTDLVIGLPSSARWEHAVNVSERGVEHAWNLPTEEVYTVPDRDRVDGQVRLSRPALVGGRIIDGVSILFRAGRAVEVSGEDGVQALREHIARDEGAGRLGEVALVDQTSRVGQLGRTFGLTLLDENAASHIALGFGFPALVDEAERDRVNDSAAHLDITIGSDEIDVVGIDRDGVELRLMHGGAWTSTVHRDSV